MFGDHGPMTRRMKVRNFKGGPDGPPPMAGKRKVG
jgi:hypothetical protein